MKISASITTLLLVLTLTDTTLHAAPGAHGPDGQHIDAPASEASSNSLARLPDGSVNVPKRAQRRMGIRTQLAIVSERAVTVELTGRVIADPNAHGRVQAVHGGRIELADKGFVRVGQTVRKGEVLAYVRHHAEPYAVGNQRAQLTELKAQRELAEQRAKRLESLEGTVPRKDIETAKRDAESLRSREVTIAGSLGVREPLVAPLAGVVTQMNVSLGQVVDARDVLIEIVDPARLQIEAVAADVNLATRIVDAQIIGTPDAKVKYLGSSRTLRDGVLPLLFAATGDARTSATTFAIGQTVALMIATRERSKGFVLPAAAIARNAANEPIVWIKGGAERYLSQPIRFQPVDASTVIVTAGLGADNRVVVEGASLLAQIR